MQRGFMITGELPPCESAVEQGIPEWSGLTIEELRNRKQEINKVVVKCIRVSEHITIFVLSWG